MTLLTQEQRNILGEARRPAQSLIVEALAGTGKTFSLIESLKMLPEASTLVLAFNTRIAKEFERKKPQLPRGRVVHVKTLHSAGYWIVRHHFPRVTVDRDITERRIRDAAGAGAQFRVLGAATRLLRVCKDLQHARELDLDVAFQLGYDFNCFDKLNSHHEVQQVIEVTARAYRASLEVAEAVDFPDQGWLPLVLGLDPPSRYKAILLDEAQDVNDNQLAMVEQLLAPGGRIIAAGDLNQQIYEWRGAVGGHVWKRLTEKYKAKRLPLTCTWRCDQAVVKEANQLVPTLRARPDAGPGRVITMPEEVYYQAIVGEDIPEGDVFVLSRTNAELLRVALEMWRRKVPFNIAQSADLLNPIKAVLRKLNAPDNRKPAPALSLTKGLDDDAIDNALSLFHKRRQEGEEQAKIARRMATGRAELTPALERFKQALGAWYMTEAMKAQNAGSASMMEKVDDLHRTILYALNYVTDPREIEPLLESIYLVDEHCWITLSTVHKAKGLEADHVFLLKETFQRHQIRKDRDGNPLPVYPEERNIEYVAITRARKTLVWVTLTGNP